MKEELKKMEKTIWLYKYEKDILYPIMKINHEYQRIVYEINNASESIYTLCKIEIKEDNPEEFSIEDVYSIQVPGDLDNPTMKMYISSEISSPFVYVVVKNIDGIIVAEENFLVGNIEVCTVDNEEVDIESLNKNENNIKSIERSLETLNDMPGLVDIKKQIQNLVECIQLEKIRKDNGLPTLEMSHHLVFTGNPGTGKTTVARILGEIYFALGVIKENKIIEVDRSGLVEGYIGQTAIKTKKVIDSAMGGILYIDEAYTLSKEGNDFGQEAIDTLLKAMEDHRKELVVIVSGYPEQMSKFIHSNPGLKSRFKNFVNFKDYTGDELYEIFNALCKKNSMRVEESAVTDLKKFFVRMSKNKEPCFANGREVRNFYENVIERQAHRIAYSNPSIMELSIITHEDLGVDNCMDNQNKAFDELNTMIGLNNAKSEVMEFVSMINTQLQREEKGLATKKINYHMVFTGNPGTGKTTVARIVAKILKNIGIISEDKLIEIDASGLIAGYVGQTAIKTTDAINSAMGGVLFIDEAYGLSRSSFGKEAIDTLLKKMEDYRDNFVVIVAGYEDEMNEFIESNPGLKSRFSNYIHFEDYSSDELFQIIKLYCLQEQYKLDVDADKMLLSFINGNIHKFSSNGRDARNLFEIILKQQARRLSDNENSIEDLMIITAADVYGAIRKYK